MDYLADLNTYFDTVIIDYNNPRAFVAKTRRNSDPENPSYNEAMTGLHAREYKIATHKEISQLIKQYTWYMITQNTLQEIPDGKYHMLPVTWDFNLKRLPNESPLKSKARYCALGKKQTEGVDYFETYIPVFS